MRAAAEEPNPRAKGMLLMSLISFVLGHRLTTNALMSQNGL